LERIASDGGAGASAGMAVFPLDGADEEALHRSADADLYADKVDMPAQPAGDRAGAATVSRGYGRGAKLMSAMDR
jgi:predicted signal transduction protein with EAL and GGDEF domain